MTKPSMYGIISSVLTALPEREIQVSLSLLFCDEAKLHESC
jgi:hypothetical protein